MALAKDFLPYRVKQCITFGFSILLGLDYLIIQIQKTLQYWNEFCFLFANLILVKPCKKGCFKNKYKGSKDVYFFPDTSFCRKNLIPSCLLLLNRRILKKMKFSLFSSRSNSFELLLFYKTESLKKHARNVDTLKLQKNRFCPNDTQQTSFTQLPLKYNLNIKYKGNKERWINDKITWKSIFQEKY